MNPITWEDLVKAAETHNHVLVAKSEWGRMLLKLGIPIGKLQADTLTALTKAPCPRCNKESYSQTLVVTKIECKTHGTFEMYD